MADQNTQDPEEIDDDDTELDAAEYDEDGNAVDVITLYNERGEAVLTFKMSDPEYMRLIDLLFLPIMKDNSGVVIFTNMEGITYMPGTVSYRPDTVDDETALAADDITTDGLSVDYPAQSLSVKRLTADFDSFYVNTRDIARIEINKNAY